MTKQQILDEISRTTKENGGKPLGIRRLSSETLIKDSDWRKYWVRLGDAHRELGIEVNDFAVRKYADEDLLKIMAEYIIAKGSFPQLREWDLRGEKPIWKVYKTRFGSKAEIASRLIKFCQELGNHEMVIELAKPIAKEKAIEPKTYLSKRILGHVYMLRSGKYYKIGKTNEVGRRMREINLELPEESVIIHSISTDDPSGIEAYWHKRFAEKRKKGEWFELNIEDIRAFRKKKSM
jgi:hypothetical protein